MSESSNLQSPIALLESPPANKKKKTKHTPPPAPVAKDIKLVPALKPKEKPEIDEIVAELITVSKEGSQLFQQKLSALSYESATSYTNFAKAISTVMSQTTIHLNEWFEHSGIFTHALTDMSQELANYTNALISDNKKASKSFSRCKTPEDFLNLQSDILKANIDAFLEESIRLVELTIGHGNAIMAEANKQTMKLSEEMATGLSTE